MKRQDGFLQRLSNRRLQPVAKLPPEEKPTPTPEVVAAPVHGPRIGYIDFVRDGEIVGWIFDPKVKIPLVRIYIDGICVGVAACDQEREDVYQAGYPKTSRGFRHDIPAQYFDGDRHELTASFLDGQVLDFSTDFGLKQSVMFRSHFVPEFAGCVDEIRGDIVSGWLLTKSRSGDRMTGGAKIAIFCDGLLAGQVYADQSRPDVADQYKSELGCGFSFQIPTRFLKTGTVVQVETFPHRWSIPGSPVTVDRLPNTDRGRLRQLERDFDRLSIDLWRARREIRTLGAPRFFMLADYKGWAKAYFSDLGRRAPRIFERTCPKVSVLCPVYRPRLKDFVAAVDSVIAQTYQDWELIVVDDASARDDLTAIITQFAARDARIKVLRHRSNKGISDATNTAIEAATGEIIAFFDHDDLLVDCALDFMVDAIVSGGADMAYSDEDKIDDRGALSEPNLKSDWNLRLMLAQNYVCHLLVARREMVLAAGPFSAKYNGAQDHDFILRLSDVVQHDRIRHVPEVLYHWRKTPNSTAETVSNKTYAIDAGVLAVGDYLTRHQIPARVTSRGAMTNYIVEWTPRDELSVSIIIPFKDKLELTRRCLKMLCDNTDYPHVEIVLLNNFSLSLATDDFVIEASQIPGVRILDIEEPFNYSRLNNLAVASCSSDLVLFLNNDVFISDRTWLTQLVGEMTWRADVGAVGCKLLYQNGTVQHAGVVLGVGEGGVAEHPFRGLVAHDPGFMGRALCSQEYSAVTAACLLMRREVFNDIGGFDEEDLTVAYNDVDLCLNIRRAGLRIVWRAETVLEHHESASRFSDMSEHKLPRFIDEHHTMHDRWGSVIAEDPYYNQHFSRDWGVFTALRKQE